MQTKPYAVFLDRDGVIIEDVGHISKPEQVKLIDGSVEAIKMLGEKYKIIIITNQAAVAKGLCSEDDARKVNDKVLLLLAEQGAIVDATYMCFHHPEKGLGQYKQNCECRKPKPGMIFKAAKEHQIEKMIESYLVGDKMSDIMAGQLAGLKTILVKTGYAGSDKGAMPHYVAEDLYEAAKLIMEKK